MTITLKNLHGFYKSSGLSSPSAETLDRRIKAAPAISKGIDETTATLLVNLVLGAPQRDEAASWLGEFFKKEDPTFEENSSSPELSLLAAVVLQEIMADDYGYAGSIALDIVTGAFGEARIPAMNKWIYIEATKKLLEAQQNDMPEFGRFPPIKKLDMAAKLKELSDTYPQNNWTISGPVISTIVTTIVDQMATTNKAIVDSMNNLSDMCARVRREVDWHWWALNGWSLSAKSAFSSMSTPELVLRSSLELSSLTNSRLGTYMAPVLLAYVLRDRTHEEVSMSCLVESAPTNWADENIPNGRTNNGIFFSPVNYALLLSSELGETGAWKAKYETEMGVKMDTKLTALDTSLQIYRELVLLKE